MKIMIPKPDFFYSSLDEKHFFLWLEEIARIRKVVITPVGLNITIRDKPNINMLYDLLALMARYKLDMKCLRPYCLEADKQFFYDEDRHWFYSMFSDSQETKQGQQDEAGQSHPDGDIQISSKNNLA
jgi:hypothetical protein